ncbi:hypothetical protein SUGI_0047100 [Cryptomeria japonica]|nr:hypothetical protein SUGI_0047100 [Cryptomeria japonica]
MYHISQHGPLHVLITTVATTPQPFHFQNAFISNINDADIFSSFGCAASEHKLLIRLIDGREGEQSHSKQFQV